MSLAPLNHTELKVQRLIVAAALDMTRLKPKARRACKGVLLHGQTYAQAGKLVGMAAQNVYRALKILKPKLAEVREYVARD